MRWHLHSIALPFGFLYGYLANVQNLCHLKTAYFEQIVGTQYIWQTIWNTNLELSDLINKVTFKIELYKN